MMFENTTTYTPPLLEQAYKANNRGRYTGTIAVGSVVGGLLTFSFLVLLWDYIQYEFVESQIGWVCSLIGAVFVFVLCVAAPLGSSKKQAAATWDSITRAGLPITHAYKFSPEGMQVSNAQGYTNYGWRQCKAARLTPYLCTLEFGGVFLVVDLGGFTQGDPYGFTQLLQSVGAPIQQG